MEMHLALSIFLLDGQARQFSDDTIDSYRSRLCAWSAWLAEQGVISLEAITSTHIRQYLVLRQGVLTERGQRTLTRGTLRRTLLRVGSRSNVKNLSPHALRRTFAIESLRAGMNLYVLQRASIFRL